MKALNILILLFSILLFSCNSTNKSVTTTSINEVKIATEKMMYCTGLHPDQISHFD